ncbi:MAG: hypothetical protein R3C58_05485 [Parvularculaceae bacterium]
MQTIVYAPLGAGAFILPSGTLILPFATLSILLERSLCEVSFRVKKKVCAPYQIVSLLRAEISPVEGARMIIEKKHLIRLKRDAPLPPWKFPSCAVRIERSRGKGFIDEYLNAAATYFIAFNGGDALDNRPIRTEISVRSDPFRARRVS